jgi:hypothetical protein
MTLSLDFFFFFAFLSSEAVSDGKGWVDAAGNVREPASEKISKDNYRPGQIPGANSPSHCSRLKTSHSMRYNLQTRKIPLESFLCVNDAAGNVREPASEKISKDNYRPGQIPGAKEKRRAAAFSSTSLSESLLSSEDEPLDEV